MLKIMLEEGKNWEKVLQLLHQEHCATHIPLCDATDKLRSHYNNFNSAKSLLKKPYHALAFKLSKKERDSLTAMEIKERGGEERSELHFLVWCR